MKGRLKTIRVFLIGVLCGVIVTATVAFLFAIPANSDYWRMEIWKRGGAAWTFDKNGHVGWMWTVEPNPDNRRGKLHILPSSQKNIPSEQL
jgi:hypothetical protein